MVKVGLKGPGWLEWGYETAGWVRVKIMKWGMLIISIILVDMLSDGGSCIAARLLNAALPGESL